MNCRKYSILISHMFTHILACPPALLPIHTLWNWRSPACYQCNNGNDYPRDILSLPTEVRSTSFSGKVIILLAGLLFWCVHCFLPCVKFSVALAISVCKSSDNQVNGMTRFAGFLLDSAGLPSKEKKHLLPSEAKERESRRKGEPAHTQVEAQGSTCPDWPSVSGLVGGCWGETGGREKARHLVFLRWMTLAAYLLLPNLAPSHSPQVKCLFSFLSESFKKSVGKGFKPPIESCFSLLLTPWES